MENICLDPTDASEIHEKDHVFFTHLTTELIHLLPVLPEKCTAFTTQEIYKLLQKLNRYCELGLDFPKNLKILPYDYPLNLKNLCVTAKASLCISSEAFVSSSKRASSLSSLAFLSVSRIFCLNSIAHSF